MVNLKINGIDVSAKEGTSILEAAKAAGINIPTLCYLKDLNEIGACRICLVEIEGRDKLFAACNCPVEEGISVLTDSAKVRQARRVNSTIPTAPPAPETATANCSRLQRNPA